MLSATKRVAAAISAIVVAICAGVIYWQYSAQKDWQFPVRIGDDREKVQRIAGIAAPAENGSPSIAWYPDSGFSVFYDDYWKVAQVNFPGTYTNWHRYEGEIYRSITTTSTYQDFQAALGDPLSIGNDENYPDSYVARWKIDNFSIEALFWTQNVTLDNVMYDKDLLRYLAIKKTL